MKAWWIGGASIALGLAAMQPVAHAKTPSAKSRAGQVDAFGQRPVVAFAQPSGTVPFELHRGTRVFLTASLNGHDTQVMLDTGANVVAIDRAYATSIGLKPTGSAAVNGAGGEVAAEMVPGISLQMGHLRIDNVTAVVMDLQPIARALGRPLPVVVGSELFDNAVVGIDWAGQHLTLTDPQAFRPAPGTTAVQLGKMGPLHSVPISVAGLPPMDAALDLGSDSTLIIPAPVWEKQPALTSLPLAEGQIGGIGGLHLVRRVTLPEVTFGGQTFSAVPATLTSGSLGGHSESAGNVGIELLKAFHVDLDLGRSKIYMRPRAERDAWQRDRAGARLELHGKRLRAAHVTPGGPAAAAGVKAGDEFIAIAGERAGDAFYSSAAGDWNRRPAGTPVELVRPDGTRLRLTLRDYY